MLLFLTIVSMHIDTIYYIESAYIIRLLRNQRDHMPLHGTAEIIRLVSLQ